MEERVYTVGMLFLFGFELIFSIPLMTDSLLDSDMSYLLMVLGAGHLFWLMYTKTGTVNNGVVVPHVFGSLGVLFSMIPLFGFTVHFITSWMIGKFLVAEFRGGNTIKKIGNNKNKLAAVQLFGKLLTKKQNQ
ncbi:MULTISPECIES: hypothetical protein [Bacillus amyloliquefaciens group]|uniref:hypothetical protein n=1 Tax=Bacillus amyloliquefaciens group TaxID=1938374 RepID=UPI00073CFB86|nr:MULTISPECIES: hypothetical protein [Bacillus amyloliquefaciens group]KTF59744.1 hypothetical protein AR691_13505 [Bacillus amyloliquefaciens]